VLNFLQVDLIKELRSAAEPNADLMEQALLTINGISIGIRSTG
jgi:phosphoenolpyruvate carboxylase